ncbi:MAG: hypothetical protein ACI8QT_000493 [Halioglobus sp.]
MNYLISGLAKSGTTMLFSRIQRALGSGGEFFFEPDQQSQLGDILSQGVNSNTLTKVLVGRVLPDFDVIAEFDKHVLIYRDPRDQFISMLLYLFYDFQVSGDQAGFDECLAALKRKQQDPAGSSAIELYNQLASRVGRAPIAVFNNLHRVQNEYVSAFSPYRTRYEDLLEGNWGGLEAYLGLTLAEDAQVPEEYHRVVRSKGYGDWRNWLTVDDIAYVNAQWGTAILSLGYALGDGAMSQEIAAETTIDYVNQFDPRRGPQPPQ